MFAVLLAVFLFPHGGKKAWYGIAAGGFLYAALGKEFTRVSLEYLNPMQWRNAGQEQDSAADAHGKPNRCVS